MKVNKTKKYNNGKEKYLVMVENSSSDKNEDENIYQSKININGWKFFI